MPEHEKTSDTSVHDKQSQDDGEHASEERAAATFNKAPMVLEPVAEAKLARKVSSRVLVALSCGTEEKEEAWAARHSRPLFIASCLVLEVGARRSYRD